MGWKYVIIRTATHDIPVLFPDCLVHKDVAERICATRSIRDGLGGGTPLSAGDVTLFITYAGGKSETLKLEARPEDLACIASFDYGVRGERDMY